MNKLKLRTFLNSAVIDPGNRKDALMKTIIAEGTAQQYEWKAMECIEEAARIRKRIEDSNGTALIDFYEDKLREAAKYISLAAVKMTDLHRPEVAVKTPEEPVKVLPKGVEVPLLDLPAKSAIGNYCDVPVNTAYEDRKSPYPQKPERSMGSATD